jgi:hypothetical protein
VFPATRQDRRSTILRELGLPVLFGAAVLLFSATMLLGVNISAVQGSVAHIQHDQQILLGISDAEAGVVGEQLTVRSYALTGNPRFLTYQGVERRKTSDAMDKIAALAMGEVDAARAHVAQAATATWRCGRASRYHPDRAQHLGKAITTTSFADAGTCKALADYRRKISPSPSGDFDPAAVAPSSCGRSSLLCSRCGRWRRPSSSFICGAERLQSRGS